jgi:hypothetical protein
LSGFEGSLFPGEFMRLPPPKDLLPQPRRPVKARRAAGSGWVC